MLSLLIFLVTFFGVLDCRQKKWGLRNFFKTKRIISKFYILFNDSQNVINNCGRVSCLSPQLAGIVRFGYASRFCSIPHQGETPHMCSSGTHVSWAQAYKAHVGGGFHCGRFIFPLYSHCGQALAPCPRGCLLYPASKGEIPFWRPS